MPKNDNAHAIRFYNSLAELDEEAAIEFAERHPLSKSAGYEKKFAWAQEQCAFLEERFPPEDIEAVRARCHCEDGKAIAARMRGYLAKTGNLSEFAQLHNQKETYGRIEAVEGGLALIYPQCYCSCVKRVDAPISRTWCLCTLGHAREMFSAVFGKPVEVQLLETVKTGGERCVIKVII